MNYEVELKAPCKDAREKVEQLGADYKTSEHQKDTYYRHPSRDYKKTDEALRIRKTGSHYLTYKGPKKEGDLKTREEIEFQVPDIIYALLERLGFEEAFTIEKLRHTYILNGLTICCDEVEGLGEYVEVESANPKDHDNIMNTLEGLGVKDKATSKTYSELLGF